MRTQCTGKLVLPHLYNSIGITDLHSQTIGAKRRQLPENTQSPGTLVDFFSQVQEGWLSSLNLHAVQSRQHVRNLVYLLTKQCLQPSEVFSFPHTASSYAQGTEAAYH